jgi:Asp-tRNA(Asn)/Glu-tRNA(Gln) amidotransferase A subunit family amidase
MGAAWEPIQTLAAHVRAGGLDPVELTELAIVRAKAAADLNAVVHLDEDGARQAAATARSGPLAGIPVLVKQIIAVEGLPFTCGSAVFAGRVADRDAEIVRRLRAAGAVIIGLTHSHEFAYGCTGTSNVSGPCRNPHDPSRITGGSSSGSAAAVGAGIVPLALGTDTAGSVRIPAALCGAVGALPARGTLPADGVFPLSQTLDRVGVLATSVADARYAVSVLSDTEPAAPAEPTRLGLLAGFTDAPPAYRAALDRLAGARLTEVDWPGWSDLAAAAFDIQGPEAAAIHADRGRDGYQPDVVERLRVAAEVPGWRYVRAREQAAVLTSQLGALLSTMDALLLPTSPIVAPPLSADEVDGRSVRDLLLANNRPLNATPFPALSVPVPTDGLPAAIQVIAAGNAQAFQVAEWIERTLSPRR